MLPDFPNPIEGADAGPFLPGTLTATGEIIYPYPVGPARPAQPIPFVKCASHGCHNSANDTGYCFACEDARAARPQPNDSQS